MGLFVSETDAATILATILGKVQQDIGETLYPGDERRQFTESMAALLIIAFNTADTTAKRSLLKYATGIYLDAIGDSYECNRLEAEPATTTLRFSMNSAYTRDVTIPMGTRASTEGGLVFATSDEATITAGDTYIDVAATSEGGGTDYNDMAAGSITTMVDLISYIDAVTNTTASTGATDEETDDDYRKRIRLKLSSFSTAGPANAYKYWALSADNTVADAYVVCDSACVLSIYIVTNDGELPDATLIATVQAAVEADDVKPLDDQVTVYAPTANNYDIELVYYVSSENEAATVEAVEEETYTDSDGEEQTGAIEAYRLWQDCTIARDINPDKLKKLILDAGADRVEITSPTYTELTGANVAHFSGTLTVSHVVYDE